MPRDSSGTYTLPQSPFTAGTTIQSAAVNSDLSDIATALTGSIPVNGAAPATGPIKFSDGTAALPSITFNSDTDSGFYLVSAGDIGLSISGTKVADVTSSGLSTTTINATTSVQQAGAALLPAGTVLPYAGSSAPTGYLICDGSAVNRTTYAGLFAAISTTYGVGDGSTTFNVPDLRGRTVFGKDDMGGSAANRITVAGGNFNGTTLGGTGGSQNHTLTTAELASHQHDAFIGDDGHTHTVFGNQVVYSPGGTGGKLLQTITDDGNVTSDTGTTGVKVRSTAGNAATADNKTANAGGGSAHTILSPAIILNYIIKH